MNGEPTPLQREIKQSRPFPTRSEEALVGILRTADRVRRRLAAALDPHGVTVQQYNVLRILRGARGTPLPTLEIGERMIEDAPGVTRLLDRLEAKGWVRRQRCTEDRRLVHCWITDEGLSLLAEVDPRIREADRSLTRVLDDAELEALSRLLDRVRAGL